MDRRTITTCSGKVLEEIGAASSSTPIKKPLTIPNHKEVARGTVKAILKDAEIPNEEFIKLLK